uniref:J domain-containing protein n=1 Tax=Onchocerca volvulus TaxID=6282 RepID=A0A8R1TMS5_ONCVO
MLFFLRPPHTQFILSGFSTWRQQLVYHTMNSTYYEILGVSKNATQAEIKSAYYERSKELHPDRKDCSNNQEVKRRSDAFVELTTAYEVLKVPERRQSYDMSLDDSRIFTDWTEGSRKSADCVGRSRTSADSTESLSFDGLFAHSQYINRKKQVIIYIYIYIYICIYILPSSLVEIYYGFWQNFGVFGDCLRFIAQSLVAAVIAVGILIEFSD